MEKSDSIINNLMLELNLASSLPMAGGKKNKMHVVASVNAIGCILKELNPRELRSLEYAVGPLLTLMTADIGEPLAVKSAFALKALMASRVCLKQLIDSEGLHIIGKIFDTLLSVERGLDLKVQSISGDLLEHLTAIYKIVSLQFPWEIVRIGAIRHCVTLLRTGALVLQTNAAGALAALSTDLDICKQMFANGAVKPILNITNCDITNEPCMLAGLGCITQFARIYDIGVKMARQGVVKVLERGLHRETGYSSSVIREKTVYALAWLSRIGPTKTFIATPVILAGLKRQFSIGTLMSKYQVVQIILLLHSSYDKERERELCRDVRDEMIALLKIQESEWHWKNLLIKAFCVLYRDNEDKIYFVEQGMIETIFKTIETKPEDLQEANLVLLLSLCSHTDIPNKVLDRGGAVQVCGILAVVGIPVIRDLAILLLKTLALYQWDVVESAVQSYIPPDRAHLRQLESPECSLFGSEYGMFIEEYLQKIITNRRDQKYLLLQFQESKGDVSKLEKEVSPALLAAYQKGFMELDQTCRGFLEVDTLKVVIVMLGEQLDDEELQDIFNEYDPELTGRMDFLAFIALMKGWKKKFGFGALGLLNNATKRGVVGRAGRAFRAWWNKNQIAQDEVKKIKLNNKIQRRRTQKLAEQFMSAEALRTEREAEMAKRKRINDVNRFQREIEN